MNRNETWQFIRDKFEILFLGILFVFVFMYWVNSEYNQNVKEVLMLILTAFVALMRIVPRPSTNVNTDVMNAQKVDNANTEQGDININTPNPTIITEQVLEEDKEK